MWCLKIQGLEVFVNDIVKIHAKWWDGGYRTQIARVCDLDSMENKIHLDYSAQHKSMTSWVHVSDIHNIEKVLQ